MRLNGAGIFSLNLLLLTAVLHGGESISAGFGTVMGGGKRSLTSRFETSQERQLSLRCFKSAVKRCSAGRAQFSVEQKKRIKNKLTAKV